MNETVMVCKSRCWECIADCHFEPAKWHTWADEEDIKHALRQGYANPKTKKCGCGCAEVGVATR